MKKLSAIILAAVLAAACSGLGNPFGLDLKDDTKTEARIITPDAGAKYFLFPVKK